MTSIRPAVVAVTVTLVEERFSRVKFGETVTTASIAADEFLVTTNVADAFADTTKELCSMLGFPLYADIGVEPNAA